VPNGIQFQEIVLLDREMKEFYLKKKRICGSQELQFAKALGPILSHRTIQMVQIALFTLNVQIQWELMRLEKLLRLCGGPEIMLLLTKTPTLSIST